MRQVIFSIVIISFGLILKSCNTTEPQPPPTNGNKATLELTLEEVSCTEAWLEFTTTNLTLPAELVIKQINPNGDTVSQVTILNTQDSLLYIDSLLPNQTYSFKASHSGMSGISSNELSVTTMDTTSHDFTFETFTFGDISNSYLFDVSIINENSIWAVGEIRIADTSAIGYTKYNAVHWNGNAWELKRIYYFGNCSAVEYPPLKAIWAFSENDIVITNGGSIGWFDGNTVNLDCRVNPLLTGAINKIWGSSSSDLHVVGNNGNIVHYNGTNWHRIESGADVDLLDVWGTPDGSIVWVSGREDGNKTVLIKIENNQTNIVFEDHYPWQIQEGRISGVYQAFGQTAKISFT